MLADANLLDISRNHLISPGHLVDILFQITKGLLYLHENQITHRNIKLSNVLLFFGDDQTRVCKLSDCVILTSHEIPLILRPFECFFGKGYDY